MEDTGIFYDIVIDTKYVIGTKVVYYTDTNNVRYTKDDILYILKYGEEPNNNIFKIVHGNISSTKNIKAKINMSSTIDNKLRCKNGALKTKQIINKKPVIILTEDSNSGYALIYNLLIRTFTDVQFEIYSCNGNKNIYDILMKVTLKHGYNAEGYIIVADDKFADQEFQEMKNKVKRFLKGKYKYGIFTPTSIEECILSWCDLQINKKSILRDKIINYFNTGIEPYLYIGEDNFQIDNKIVKNIELLLSSELNRISSFMINKKYINECVYTNCCNRKLRNKVIMVKWCSRHNNINKIQSIMQKSLFGGLYNIVSNMIYKNQPALKHWNQKSKDLLYNC